MFGSKIYRRIFHSQTFIIEILNVKFKNQIVSNSDFGVNLYKMLKLKLCILEQIIKIMKVEHFDFEVNFKSCGLEFHFQGVFELTVSHTLSLCFSLMYLSLSFSLSHTQPLSYLSPPLSLPLFLSLSLYLSHTVSHSLSLSHTQSLSVSF